VKYTISLTPEDQERFGLVLQRAIDSGHPRGSYLRAVLGRMHRMKQDEDGWKALSMSNEEHTALTDALMDASIRDYYWAPKGEDEWSYPSG